MTPLHKEHEAQTRETWKIIRQNCNGANVALCDNADGFISYFDDAEKLWRILEPAHLEGVSFADFGEEFVSSFQRLFIPIKMMQRATYRAAEYYSIALMAFAERKFERPLYLPICILPKRKPLKNEDEFI